MQSLAYKLCEQHRLPVLVTDLITSYLNEQDLLTIGTLSRDLNIHASTTLYRHGAIHLDGSEKSIIKASLLFRTLLTNDTAADAVASVSLAGEPLLPWRTRLIGSGDAEGHEHAFRGKTPPNLYADVTHFNRREKELYDNVAASSPVQMRARLGEVPAWALCLCLLRLTPRIRDLSISSDYFRFSGFRDVMRSMAETDAFPNLQRYNLSLDLLDQKLRHPRVVEDWDQALLMPFVPRNAQSVAVVTSLKSEAVRRLRLGSLAITRLVLHHYQIQDSDLSALLAATPQLQYLEYHATTDWDWLRSRRRRERNPGHDIGLDLLFDALHHVSDSLQELHTSAAFDEESCYFHPSYVVDHRPHFRQPKELSGMKQLHTLSIPYITLLRGWDPPDRDWEQRCDEVFPQSLRNLTLTDHLSENCLHGSWTDRSLMPVISRMVKWLSSTQPADNSAEFGLSLFKLEEDFNLSVREELSRMCRDHGVRCSIEKARQDRERICQMPRGRGRGSRARGRGRGGSSRQ